GQGEGAPERPRGIGLKEALDPWRSGLYRLPVKKASNTIRVGLMPLQALELLEKKIERQIRRFELKRGVLGKKIGREIKTQRRRIGLEFENQKKKFAHHIRRFEQRNGISIDDEFRFFRCWMEKPLAIGAVTPSSRALARTMASYVDPDIP